MAKIRSRCSRREILRFISGMWIFFFSGGLNCQEMRSGPMNVLAPNRRVDFAKLRVRVGSSCAVESLPPHPSSCIVNSLESFQEHVRMEDSSPKPSEAVSEDQVQRIRLTVPGTQSGFAKANASVRFHRVVLLPLDNSFKPTRLSRKN